jgi:hypothetical protein
VIEAAEIQPFDTDTLTGALGIGIVSTVSLQTNMVMVSVSPLATAGKGKIVILGI